MKYILATVVVTSGAATNLRQLAQRLDRGDLDGMFKVGLSATGNAPATHYISTGYMPKPFLKAMRSPTLMFNTAKAAWQADGEAFPLTQAQVTNCLDNCSVAIAGDEIVDGVPTEQTPVVEGDTLPETLTQTLERLGLKIIIDAPLN